MKKLRLLSLLLYVIRLSAQTDLPNAFPNNHFLVYTTADGLPSNIIHAIATDKDGFMWIATTNGLARYNGQRFTPFRDLVVHSDLPETQIQYVFADSHGFLWLRYASKAVYLMDLRTYKVTELKDNFWKQDENYYPSGLEDKVGDVWFSVLEGVVKWQYLDKKWVFYPFTIDSTQKIIRICKGGDNYFWATTRQNMYRFDIQKNVFEKEQNLIGHVAKVRAIETDEAGKLWLSNWYNNKEGVVWYDPQQRQILQVFNEQAAGAFSNTDMWHIHAAEGRVWFAANFGGITAFDPAQNRFQNYKPDPNNPFSIQSEMVFFIHTDKIGNTWIGTPNGLHCLPKHLKKTQLLKYVPKS